MGRRRRRWFLSQDDMAETLVDMALADRDAARARMAERARMATRRRLELIEQRHKDRIRANAAERAVRLRNVRKVPHAPGWRVLLERMESGAWYGSDDMVRLMPEYAAGSVDAWLYQKLLANGLVERTLNPEHDAARPDRRQTEPRYLYRRASMRVR